MESVTLLAMKIAHHRMRPLKDFVQETAGRIAARDAEWQARVDTLLEDNVRSEEQVKKQFATAVGLKARAEKAEARVDKLEAVLKECGRKLDEALDAEDWGEVESVWCDIDAALGRA